ncbi:hypothetical protein [Geodermatophilus ruber]|uniref:Helix-turn-helix domain-containing protein n=1 Tax=Geodermatophilus ruber TaxID=504800 RepID=A0A1I3YZL2_9ACTN|nr:hypothetical protein [Geodermatophilus ruber]SFK37230.1 hypothetical protein SAMN04488085_101273 [Geodermatophilus ruber]
MSAMTQAELAALPATVDVVTAARALSCGRTLAYQLVRAGQFPARVVRLGSRYRVVTGGPDGLLAALGIEPAADSPRSAVTTSPPNLRPVSGL